MESQLTALRSLLAAKRHDSVAVDAAYEECFVRWKDGLRETHGFGAEAFEDSALKELYLAESTFVAATLICMTKYVDDMKLGNSSPSSQLDAPNIISVIHTHYGWATGVVSRDDGCSSIISGIRAFEIIAGTDPFSAAFEDSIPRDVRHKSGAFLTPPWMADHLVSRLVRGANWTRQRFLEPCAGTGAFLAALVRHLRRLIEEGQLTSQQAFDFLSQNFVSIERNPSSCFALYANLVASLSHFAGERVRASYSTGCVRLADCTDESHYIGRVPDSGRERIFEALPERESFDFIVGNPPWISWETLDRDYRKRIAPVWAMIGLFDGTGSAKSFSKEDICTFVTYVCVDRFLKPGGTLSFILPQAIFQSSLNSRGFRGFCLRRRSSLVPLRVLRVDDMTRIPAFAGVSVRPAILTIEKGSGTEFPVEYNIYTRLGTAGNFTLKSENLIAEPVSVLEKDSAWSIHSRDVGARNLRQVSGKCAYRARAGVFTGGANAAYYLGGCKVHGELVTGETVVERAKRKIPSRRVVLESKFVYPFIRGRDVSFWRVNVDPGRAIILPHTPESRMAPIPPGVLGVEAPRTLSYFLEVKDFLDGRRGLTAMDKANAENGFYALLRVGPYTFAPYKLVWKYIAKDFTCAVVGSHPVGAGHIKPVIPQEKLMMIGFDSDVEAYFVCGMLSSSLFSTAIKSRMVSTQISAKIIESLRVPKFDPKRTLHREISGLCRRGHETASVDSEALHLIRQSLDETVEALLHSEMVAS